MKDDVLRYLGYGGQVLGEALQDDLDQQIEHARSYRGAYVYRILDKSKNGDLIHRILDGSETLKRFLGQPPYLVLFAVSLGAAFDRQLTQVGLESKADQVILNACGSARVEGILEDMKEEVGLASKLYPGLAYCPGYGDFSLAKQKIIFDILKASQIGIELKSSFSLLPTKSMMGVFGLYPEVSRQVYNPCDGCLIRLSCDRKRCKNGK